MNIYLFGKSSLSGETFYEYFNSQKNSDKIHYFSRDAKDGNKLDLTNPSTFNLVDSNKFKIISFAPIWDLSYFLDYLFKNDKDKLNNLEEIIACSSTSALTKRFESNNFDKKLSSNLIRSEEMIMEIAQKLRIACQIIRPTLIYGTFKGLKDKNISKILFIMRTLNFIFLPSNTGNRQPIHALQLAEVVYFLMNQNLSSEVKPKISFINIGGDETLDFIQMLKNLQDSLKENDKAKRCVILKIPNRLFFILISPIIIFSPKNFAALSRICSNLSGFHKASYITKTQPKTFPFKDI
tara:strand:- start:241 stop:1125 length:885 start_codon:yes stop_codon:yes gene_type:complete